MKKTSRKNRFREMTAVEVMNEIVSLEGKCLKASLCGVCPFKKQCLPMFLYPESTPSENQRLNRAIDTLADRAIFGEQLSSTSAT
jgi:hypothetical protein